MSQEREPGRRSIDVVRQVVRVTLLPVLSGVGIRCGWWQLWLFLPSVAFILAANLAVMARFNPVLITQRMKPDRPEERFDWVFFVLAGLLMAALYATAGADTLYYHWLRVPWQWSAAGLVGLVAGDIPVMASLATNPFLERTSRLQRERGQHVVTRGPYRFVRHPMYVGIIAMLIPLPLVLGSLVATIPAVLLVVVLVVRTHFEDRMLRERLDGYERFAQSTRYRLVPGVW